MPYDQNYSSIGDPHEFRFIICLHCVTRMLVQLLRVLIQVFLLPTNFLVQQIIPSATQINRLSVIIILFPVWRYPVTSSLHHIASRKFESYGKLHVATLSLIATDVSLQKRIATGIHHSSNIRDSH